MGFASVYRSLQEIFPQVDARLLRAVAIENSKDADVAVEVVLAEVLPYMSQHSTGAQSESQNNGSPSEGGEELEEQSDLVRRQRVDNEARAGTDFFLRTTACEDTTGTGNTGFADATSMHETFHDSLGTNFCCTNDGNENVFLSNESEEWISMVEAQKTSDKNVSDPSCSVMSNGLMNEEVASDVFNNLYGATEMGIDELISCQRIDNVVEPKQDLHVISTTSIYDEAGLSESLKDLPAVWADFPSFVSQDFDTAIHENNHKVELCFDSNLPVDTENCVVKLTESSIAERHLHTEERYAQSDSGTPSNDYEKVGISESLFPDSTQLWSDSEIANGEHGTTFQTLVSRSGQNCRADILDGIIEEAKNNKKTLFSAMESVINMMRDVEAQVTAAEEAQDEAVRGGVDILKKVDELKQMLVHAKEANDMHAGEVYGERAILATEAKELQSRLLNLSDERDKSLSILDEMQQTLKARLAAAEEMRRAAILEKQAKEESARIAFAKQEALMEKVIEESKILQQEAEENSKLREFLMDRGRVVDVLQGEISVICQDAMLLKEKFDNCVPLSKSISSSQTTCILASSSSSFKSLVIEQNSSKTTPEKASPAPSVSDGESQGEMSQGEMSPRLENKRAATDLKAVSDDGWDFVDNDAEFV